MDHFTNLSNVVRPRDAFKNASIIIITVPVSDHFAVVTGVDRLYQFGPVPIQNFPFQLSLGFIKVFPQDVLLIVTDLEIVNGRGEQVSEHVELLSRFNSGDHGYILLVAPAIHIYLSVATIHILPAKHLWCF